MYTVSSLVSLLALAVLPVSAIPPESFGFPSAPNDTALTVAYNYNGNITQVSEAILFGAGIPGTEPTLAVNTAMYRSLAEYDGVYTVLMVDPDASTPQNPTSRFILHWMQPNMQPSTTTMMNVTGQPLMNTTAPAVPYARPMPPPTSDPHRYILYAFEQPEDFAVPAAYSGYSAENRTNFNLTDFISAASLGTPAAAQFFFCSNKSSVPQDFIAAPGGTYPGGNGEAVTAGPGPAATASSSATATGATTSAATATASTMGNAAAPMADSGLMVQLVGFATVVVIAVSLV